MEVGKEERGGTIDQACSLDSPALAEILMIQFILHSPYLNRKSSLKL